MTIKNPNAANCKLLAKTIELLTNSEKSIAKVAEETGLPFYWVQSVRYNNRIDPSVTRTIKLYEYLSGKTLEV